MKTKFLSLVALLFLFGSCSSSNSDTAPADSYSVKVKIDGKQYEATGLFVYAANTDDTYNVYATFEGNRTMYLQLEKAKGVGKHQIVANPNFAFYSDETSTGNRSDRTGCTGEVEVTAKSATEVKGKFSFTAKNANNSTKVYAFTEGEFSAKFR
jgi:hypothetical protein